MQVAHFLIECAFYSVNSLIGTAFCSSTKLPTTLLKFIIACSTRDEDGGGYGWDDDDPCCCCAAEGT